MAVLPLGCREDIAEGRTNVKMIYPIAARCGVFAKTDIQPLINEGASIEDLAASIFQAVVNQTISGLACGHPIKGKVAFLGGPLTFLSELRKRFIETLELSIEDVIFPEDSKFLVAHLLCNACIRIFVYCKSLAAFRASDFVNFNHNLCNYFV